MRLKEILSKKTIGKGCYMMTAKIISATAQQETTIMERVFNDVFSQEKKLDCRTYRIEVRTPDGAIRFYGLKAIDKSVARKEAIAVVQELVTSFQDERILWRMAGEKGWSLNGSTSHTKKPSLFARAMNYFFDLEDED